MSISILLAFFLILEMLGSASLHPTYGEIVPTDTESILERIGTDAAIGHDGFIKNTVFAVEKQFPSPSKIGIGEITFAEVGFADSSIFKYGFSKIDLNKATLSENSISKIDPWHITSAETTLIHADADKLSKTQVTLIEPTSDKIRVTEIGFLVDTTSNNVINPMGTSKVPSSEIPVTPSVLSNQFLSIHDSIPQIITNLQDTASKVWLGLRSHFPFQFGKSDIDFFI